MAVCNSSTTKNGKVELQTPTSAVDKNFDWTGSSMRVQNLQYKHKHPNSVDSLDVAQILHLVHLFDLSNDVLHRIERLLGTDMRVIPQHIKAVAKKPRFPHVADPLVDAFYIYDNPAITMNKWTRICERRTQIDYLSLKSLEEHPARTFDPEKATTFVIPTQMYQSFLRPDKTGHVKRLKDAMGALTSSKYFLRKRGYDHILSTFHWQFSRWSIGLNQWRNLLPQEYISLLENVTTLRYEVYGQSKWRNRYLVTLITDLRPLRDTVPVGLASSHNSIATFRS